MIKAIRQYVLRRRFEKYMRNIDGELGDVARDFWSRVEGFVPGLPVPQCGPSEDGNSFQFVWDWGVCGGYDKIRLPRYHLDIDVYLDGRFDWFYSDRATEQYDGSEEFEDHFDALPIDILKLIK